MTTDAASATPSEPCREASGVQQSPQSPIANHQTLLPENNPPDVAGKVSPTASATIASGAVDERTAYRKEVLALCHLCEVAKRPDKLAGFISQDITVAAASEILLGELAETSNLPQQAIVSQPTLSALDHAPDSGGNPLLRMARERASEKK